MPFKFFLPYPMSQHSAPGRIFSVISTSINLKGQKMVDLMLFNVHAILKERNSNMVCNSNVFIWRNRSYLTSRKSNARTKEDGWKFWNNQYFHESMRMYVCSDGIFRLLALDGRRDWRINNIEPSRRGLVCFLYTRYLKIILYRVSKEITFIIWFLNSGRHSRPK